MSICRQCHKVLTGRFRMHMELNSKDCGVMDVREGIRHKIMDFMKKTFTYINPVLQST